MTPLALDRPSPRRSAWRPRFWERDARFAPIAAPGATKLTIKASGQEVGPSLDNVKSGKYPLSRDLYFYLRQKPSGEAKAFIDFRLSPEGQQIVSEVGYYPACG